MPTILSEITALSQQDCFYIVERHKKEFTYPLHQHREYELNFVQNGQGLRRIIGDSVEETGPLDLVLITGENLEHVWEQGSCTAEDIREITIHFSYDLFSSDLLGKNQFARIRQMLDRAKHGLAFAPSAILKVYHLLDTLATEKDSFQQFISCLQLSTSCRDSRHTAWPAVLSPTPRRTARAGASSKSRTISAPTTPIP